jgi:bifunctional UDP-N-acetylglucosamine pyrophosphorylase/glucosamine-1-phosphate N-acetyltransferase
VLAAGSAIDPVSKIVVLSPAIAADPAWTDAGIDAIVAVQDSPLGTADAAAVALRSIPDVDWLLVLFADHPLLTGATVEALYGITRSSGALVTILTCMLDDVGAYARVERDERGNVCRIVERKDDDPERRHGRTEINSGMMVIDAKWVRTALPKILASPKTGEFYLPELVRIAIEEHAASESWPVQSVSGKPDDLLGINDRIELAHADSILRRRIRQGHMLAGVSMVMPETIAIDEGVFIGRDTTILPHTVIETGTRIGERCVIGPHAVLRAASIGDGVTVRGSTIVSSSMAAGSDAGPYAHLRGGARVGERVHIGSYAELKNAAIGTATRIGHVSYLGDVTVGEHTNIGAGAITCNYDGVRKHHTEIGSHVFIGSDTMLVAPVTVEDGASTGAGAVVTHDVASGTTVAGVPARPMKPKP